MDILALVNQSWSWTGLNAKEVLAQNAFGNLILKSDTGKIWRIMPEELSCEIVAQSEADFESLSQTDDFQIDWEMENLVHAACNALGAPPVGYVYYLVIPAVLGGKYEVENIRCVPLEELIGFSASFAEQIKDLPDGAEIKINVI